MKKLIAVAPVILVILYSFIPLLFLIGYCVGLTLELRFGEELIALFGIFSLVILFNLSDYKLEMDKTNIILSTLMFPLSFLSGLCVISSCKSFGSIVFSFICFICAFKFICKGAKNQTVRNLYKMTAVTMGVFLGMYSLMTLLFGGYSGRKVSEGITSPAGTYTAQVVSRSQSTTVEVYENDRVIDLVLFYYDDTPQCINVDSMEADAVALSFADENTVVINGTAYPIN